MRTNKGFSLVEVTLSVGIVAVAILVIMALMPVGISSQRQVVDETIASQLVADMFSHARRGSFTNAITFPSTNYVVGVGPESIRLSDRIAITNHFDANGIENDPWNVGLNPNAIGTPRIQTIYEVKDHPLFPGATNLVQIVITARWPVVDRGTWPYDLATNYHTRTYVSAITDHF